MAEILANEKRFWGKTDSETIQNAVDYAEKTGAGEVIIPAENTRTGETVWIIGETILLPDCMTVVVDNAHLRLMDNVRSNIFRNRDCETEKARTMGAARHPHHRPRPRPAGRRQPQRRLRAEPAGSSRQVPAHDGEFSHFPAQRAGF